MPKKYAVPREPSERTIRQPQAPSLGPLELPSTVETTVSPPRLETGTEFEPPWARTPPLDGLLPATPRELPPIALPPVALPPVALPPVALPPVVKPTVAPVFTPPEVETVPPEAAELFPPEDIAPPEATTLLPPVVAAPPEETAPPEMTVPLPPVATAPPVDFAPPAAIAPPVAFMPAAPLAPPVEAAPPVLPGTIVPVPTEKVICGPLALTS